MMSQVILVKRRKTVLIVLKALIARSYLRGTDSAPKRFRKDIDLITAMYWLGLYSHDDERIFDRLDILSFRCFGQKEPC